MEEKAPCRESSPGGRAEIVKMMCEILGGGFCNFWVVIISLYQEARCSCMLEINMEKRKHYFFYSSLDFFCTSVKTLFHCQISLSYL